MPTSWILSLTCKIIVFASFTIAAQYLSTRPFCSLCLEACCEPYIIFTAPFQKVSDLKLLPASDQICIILPIFLLLLDIIDISNPITFMHTSNEICP